MDRLSLIEEELKNVILKIDGTLQPTGYTYYTSVDIVNVEDEGWIDVQNYVTETSPTGLNSYPSINIYLDPREDTYDHTANVYANKDYFRLVGRVQNDSMNIVPQNSKFDINRKMNELLSDVKFVIAQNNTLNDTVDRCNLVRSERKYTQDNKVYRTGDIIIYLEVKYTQSFSNPDLNVCY